MAFVVSGIGVYTDQTSQELVKKLLLTGRTMEQITVIPGIKYKEALNLLTNTVTIGAATCGFSPNGSVAFTQRDIAVTAMEVKDTLCPKTLEKYWMGQMMKPGAAQDTELGQILAESYIEKIKLANEFELWQGDIASGATYNQIDGFLYLLKTNAVSAVRVTAQTGHTASDIVAHVNDMVANIPEDILAAENLTLFMSYANYMLYTAALRTANMFHYNGENGAGYECFIPGTNVKASATRGLNGSPKFVLTYATNLVAGVDLLNEEEKFEIWYSKDNDEVRVNIQWKLGAQIYFPAYCVVNWAGV